MQGRAFALAQRASGKRRDGEVFRCLITLTLTFLLFWWFDWHVLLPGFLSASLELWVEVVLLILCLALLFFYMVQARGSSSSVSSSGFLSGPSTSHRSQLPTLLPPMSTMRALSSPTSPPPQHHHAPSSSGGGGGVGVGGTGTYRSGSTPHSGSRQRRYVASPQYDDGNYRSSANEYSWDDIQATRTRYSSRASSSAGGLPGTSLGGGGILSPGGAASGATVVAPNSSSRNEWTSEPPTAYKPSPMKKVTAVKRLDDGRSISYIPALDELGKEQLSSLWAETLRKVLGGHVNTYLKELDKAAAALGPYVSDTLAKGAAAAAAPAKTGMIFQQFPLPGATAAVATAPLSLETKRGVLDVLSLRAESVRLDAQGSPPVDLFGLLDKVTPAAATAGWSDKLKVYKDKIQVLSVLGGGGDGCPLTNRAKNLVGIYKEMRSMCSSHDGYLRLAGAGAAGSSRGGGGGRGRQAANAAAVGNDDNLIMSIFFNYCDLVQSDAGSSSKHNFTRQYYVASYEDLLDGKGGMSAVGIVKNYHGEFDVYVRTTRSLHLLEIAAENENVGFFAYNVILVFLATLYKYMEASLGPDEYGAVKLLQNVLDCDRAQLPRTFREHFPV